MAIPEIDNGLFMAEVKERFPYAYVDAKNAGGVDVDWQVEYIRNMYSSIFRVLVDEVENAWWDKVDVSSVYTRKYHLDKIRDSVIALEHMEE